MVKAFTSKESPANLGTRGGKTKLIQWMKAEPDRFLLYPMGISFFGLFEVRSKEPGWTQCPVWEASTFRGPQGGPQPGWEGGLEELSARRHLPLELSSPTPSQVSLRGCQGFTCWLRSSSFLMKGQAGGVFVAGTAGRGGGPTVRPPWRKDLRQLSAKAQRPGFLIL